MKTLKKLLSVALAFCLCLSFITFGFAEANDTDKKASDYPFVFVHGIFGWGENDTVQKDSSYWGFADGTDVVEYMRSLGLECCSPSLGKISSAWDRACELYAQLTGTVVDYGAAHSQKYGHERFGRDYTGKASLGYNWNLSDKINLITHSFGGPTATLFVSMLSNGSAEETAASPLDCSEFFKGGHADSVYSVTELNSPHNGTPLADFLYDAVLPIMVVSLVVNTIGLFKTPVLDFMLDQWGLTKDPSTGERAKLSLKDCINFSKAGDNCAKDMTINGAKEFNSLYKEVPSVYYFSYACRLTKTSSTGLTVPVDYKNFMASTAMFTASLSCLYIDGKKLGSAWADNDGNVPVISALYPFTAEQNHAYYEDGMAIVPGVWYVMPIVEGGSHSTYVSGDKQILYSRYDNILSVLNNI